MDLLDKTWAMPERSCCLLSWTQMHPILHLVPGWGLNWNVLQKKVTNRITFAHTLVLHACTCVYKHITYKLTNLPISDLTFSIKTGACSCVLWPWPNSAINFEYPSLSSRNKLNFCCLKLQNNNSRNNTISTDKHHLSGFGYKSTEHSYRQFSLSNWLWSQINRI